MDRSLSKLSGYCAWRTVMTLCLLNDKVNVYFRVKLMSGKNYLLQISYYCHS